MGNGMCSRKQKRIFQTLLLLTVVFGFLYGAMLYYELQGQLRKAEATALKYQQHQESLSAQLQGTYLGRSLCRPFLWLAEYPPSSSGEVWAPAVQPLAKIRSLGASNPSLPPACGVLVSNRG